VALGGGEYPRNVTELASNAGAVGGANLPPGANNVRVDFGFAGWGGTCPPQGDKPHRYIFSVYALKTDKIDVPATQAPRSQAS